MPTKNRHGLSRHIDADTRRKIRQRCKFGCVVCREGLYTYEHIDPTFEDAECHDAERMCCLCATHQDAVSRGLVSKAFVLAKYAEVAAGDVPRPRSFLDLHKGEAELVIGGIGYSPALRTILRFHGEDVIRVDPSDTAGTPGSMSAVFTDDTGEETLRLVNNEWFGSLSAWDIEVSGVSLTVRRKRGSIALRLRMDPPSRIVVERLDMRFKDTHIIATEHSFAVGRYTGRESELFWTYSVFSVQRTSRTGAAIEITSPEELVRRLQLSHFLNRSREMSSPHREVIMDAIWGMVMIPSGIVFASQCGQFAASEFVGGVADIEEVRRAVISHPLGLGEVLCKHRHPMSFAYSTRRVIGSYSGPLFRIRRDSDNAERDVY